MLINTDDTTLMRDLHSKALVAHDIHARERVRAQRQKETFILDSLRDVTTLLTALQQKIEEISKLRQEITELREMITQPCTARVSLAK